MDKFLEVGGGSAPIMRRFLALVQARYREDTELRIRFGNRTAVPEVVADLDNDIGLIADPFKNPGENLRDKFIRRRDSRTRLLAKAILIPWDENVR